MARPLGVKPPADARGNLPGGWAGYALARPDTLPRYQPKRHGKWVHGGRSRTHAETMGTIRWCMRLLRLTIRPTGFPPPFEPAAMARPVGWRAWADGRPVMRGALDVVLGIMRGEEYG